MERNSRVTLSSQVTPGRGQSEVLIAIVFGSASPPNTITASLPQPPRVIPSTQSWETYVSLEAGAWGCVVIRTSLTRQHSTPLLQALLKRDTATPIMRVGFLQRNKEIVPKPERSDLEGTLVFRVSQKMAWLSQISQKSQTV